MECTLLLNIIVTQGSPILQLFSRENETLLVWGDPLLVLDLRLDVVDGIARLHFECDCFSSECFDEDLHGVLQCIYFSKQVSEGRPRFSGCWGTRGLYIENQCPDESLYIWTQVVGRLTKCEFIVVGDEWNHIHRNLLTFL